MWHSISGNVGFLDNCVSGLSNLANEMINLSFSQMLDLTSQGNKDLSANLSAGSFSKEHDH